MQSLILASSSPRRKELLENLHFTFSISKSPVDETLSPELSPADAVLELSSRKAESVAKSNPGHYVLGADTVVALNGSIMGKPKSEQEALETLRRLSGQTHTVFTGVTIVAPLRQVRFFEKTDVTFWELSDQEIRSYISSGEPFDKAGSYGIQGLGATLVRKINGDYFNVVGLPISRLIRELKTTGFRLPF